MHGKYAFVRIETVTERRRLRRLFFCVFLLPIVDTLLAVVVTKARLRQKLASLPLCKLYEKTTFSAWLCKHFPAFVRLFVLHRLFALERCFPFVGNGLKRLRKVQTSTYFFIFGKSGAIGFFVLLFWAKFHFITSIFSGKNNQRQINIRL